MVYEVELEDAALVNKTRKFPILGGEGQRGHGGATLLRCGNEPMMFLKSNSDAAYSASVTNIFFFFFFSSSFRKIPGSVHAKLIVMYHLEPGVDRTKNGPNI